MKEFLIEITDRCPMHCMFCSTSATLSENNSYIDPDSIIHYVNKFNPKLLQISGGEPFSHPDIISIITRLLKETNVRRIEIYTSGITDKYTSIPDEFFDIIRNEGVIDRIELCFNIQSLSPSIYDRITDTEGLFPVMIESLKKAKLHGIKTRVHIVPNAITMPSIPETIGTLINDYGVYRVKLLRLTEQGRAKENWNALNPSESDIAALIEKYRGNPKVEIGDAFIGERCTFGTGKFIITVDGYAHPCSSVKTYRHIFGVRASDISDLDAVIDKWKRVRDKLGGMPCRYIESHTKTDVIEKIMEVYNSEVD